MAWLSVAGGWPARSCAARAMESPRANSTDLSRVTSVSALGWGPLERADDRLANAVHTLEILVEEELPFRCL